MMKMLYATISLVLESAVNLALKADPEYRSLLQSLHGKSMSIKLSDFPFCLTLIPLESRLTIHLNGDEKASVLIAGMSSDLIALGLSDHPQSVLGERHIDVNGNLHVLMAYQKLLHQLDLDWEGLLARYVGDMPARELCRPARATQKWAKAALSSARLDITEYLQEEARLFPPREAVQDFYEDIISLKNQIERLEKRTDHL